MNPTNVSDDLDCHVRQFLGGMRHESERCTNLLYDISHFSKTLKNLDQLWGVSSDMHRVLEELSSHFA
jgi:hypothetical protein